MTQEQKDLLLKDLCARLPYGVKFLRESWNYEWDQELSVIEVLEDIDKDGYINNSKVYKVEDIKPYLRPLSSITEEEKEEIKPLFSKFTDESGKRVLVVRQNKMALYQDWLNAHYFDYRGLIPMGLAIEVTEKNNPYK